MRLIVDEFKMLAQSVIIYSDWYYFAKESGFRFEDIPDNHIKENLVEFDSLVKEKGFEFASHSKIDFADGLEVKRIASKETVLEACRTHLNIWYAKVLARKILIEPAKAQDFISEFKERVPDEKSEFNFASDILELYPKIIERAEKEEPFVTIPNWEKFSTMVGGFNPERVGILVAKSGFGKTTLCVNLALKASEKKPVIYFNMEMSRMDFFEKAVMASAKMSYRDIKFFPKQNEYRVAELISKLGRNKFYYTDGKTQSLDKIESVLRRRASENIGFVFVDYDQKISLTTSKETPEWKAVQLAVEKLEEIAKKYKVFIFLLAQENDSGDISSSKRAKNPATFVCRFFEEEIFSETKYFIQAIKNRFGPTGAALEVHYEQEIGHVAEKDGKFLSRKDFIKQYEVNDARTTKTKKLFGN